MTTYLQIQTIASLNKLPQYFWTRNHQIQIHLEEVQFK